MMKLEGCYDKWKYYYPLRFLIEKKIELRKSIPKNKTFIILNYLM